MVGEGHNILSPTRKQWHNFKYYTNYTSSGKLRGKSPKFEEIKLCAPVQNQHAPIITLVLHVLRPEILTNLAIE